MSLQDINFESEAQLYAPIQSGAVYFYSMVSTSINIRKKCVNDFSTWVVVYNHFDNLTVIITGDSPDENIGDYTLLHLIENFVKQDPPAPTDPEPTILE